MKYIIRLVFVLVVFTVCLILVVLLLGKCVKEEPIKRRDYHIPPEKCIDGIVWYLSANKMAPKIVRDADGTSGISYVFCKEGGER
jgi:hypothetical protein